MNRAQPPRAASPSGRRAWHHGSMKRGVAVAAVIVASGWSSPVLAAKVSSISQYGITWTFSEPREAGQFASGDWWVVGPVTIEAVAPAPTANRNGSSVNPRGGRQGYDDRGGEYATTDNVSFPLVLKVDESLVSSISQAEGIEVRNVGALKSQAVLTAVSAPLSASALRPSYAGTHKKYLDASKILWSRLPNLPPPASLPNAADLLKQAERPRIDHLSSWTIQDSCAHDNWYNGEGEHACYGREYATFVSNAALYVMLDTPEKKELTTSLVQLGIDNYGVLKAGGKWGPNGGHHSARKWPIVFAARMIEDCDMLRVGLDYGPDSFGEDGQTYDGKDGKALFGWDCAGGQGTYFEDGCTGGGAKDCRDPQGAVDGCPDYRDCCTSAYWVGQMLSTLMIQSKAVWNHDPYFDYVDRWMKGDVSGSAETSSPFVSEMWALYREKLPPGTPASSICGALPGEPDAGALDADAGNGGTDGGDPGVGPVDGERGDGGGCGCRTTSLRIGSVVWLSLLGVAAAVARRRAAGRNRGR
jgi:hypothetical protein